MRRGRLPSQSRRWAKKKPRVQRNVCAQRAHAQVHSSVPQPPPVLSVGWTVEWRGEECTSSRVQRRLRLVATMAGRGMETTEKNRSRQHSQTISSVTALARARTARVVHTAVALPSRSSSPLTPPSCCKSLSLRFRCAPTVYNIVRV